eukprot:GHVR01041511.1.p1 GENE.GHVR01041511.1~~GHVR01041511.1.p1  ORF type:complete len:276 (-),score=96.03 GHVR01041511.1:29-856(-)
MSTTNPLWRTTEWEDILARHKIIDPPAPVVTEEQLTRVAVEVAESYDPLAHKTIEQLNKLEDDVEEDELEKYRQKRLAEMKSQALSHKFGSLYHIHKDEFVKEITEASHTDTVVCHLYQECLHECIQINNCLNEIANKYKKIKITKGISTDLIPNYPNSNLPTLLIYKNGICTKQIIGPLPYRDYNKSITVSTCLWVLCTLCNVFTNEEIDLYEDPRIDTHTHTHNKSGTYSYNRGALFGNKINKNDNSSNEEDNNNNDDIDDRGYSSNRLGGGR